MMLALAGCSASPAGHPADVPDVSEAWRVQIDQDVARGYLSEFEREVLADYWVTDEEYARSRESIPGCMAERGFVADMLPEGGITLTADPAYWTDRDLTNLEVGLAVLDIGDSALAECQAGRIWVEMYYWDMRANPQAWDFWEAVARCAERLGLTEAAGLAPDELRASMEASDTFLAECQMDPWAIAQGGEPFAEHGEPVSVDDDTQG